MDLTALSKSIWSWGWFWNGRWRIIEVSRLTFLRRNLGGLGINSFLVEVIFGELLRGKICLGTSVFCFRWFFGNFFRVFTGLHYRWNAYSRQKIN